MKKFLLTFIGIISLILTSPAVVLATGSTLSLSPASGTFNRDCNFSLQVLVDTGGFETAGTDVILNYDTTRFIANRISNGSIYPDFPGNNIDTQNGTVLISGLASATSSYRGSGVLATVDLTVLESAPPGASQIKFDFDPNNKSKTTDSNVVEVGTMAETINQVVDGNYVVGTGSCGGRGGITPSATPTATIFQPPPPTPTLNQTADTATILTIVIAGGVLTMLGIFGLARL